MNVVTQFVGRDVINKNTTDLAVVYAVQLGQLSSVELCRYKHGTPLNTRLQFFSQRVINRWNSLMEEDISVSSVNCFKHRLEKRRNRQMDFFKDR